MPSRTDLLKTLRHHTQGDLWLSQYALFHLCADVDLGCLIGLVETVLDASEARDTQAAPLSLLLAERWDLPRT